MRVSCVLASCAVMVAASWTQSGCGGDSAGVSIEVCGDARVPEDLDVLRVSVLDAQRDEIRRGSREMVNCVTGVQESLPQVVEFPEVSGELWLVVQGLRRGVEVLRFEQRTTLESGERLETLVGLTRSCMGVQCALGQTCVDGSCVEAPFETDADRAVTCAGGPPALGSDLPADTPPLCEELGLGGGDDEDMGAGGEMGM